jgi:hypothetical protein
LSGDVVHDVKDMLDVFVPFLSSLQVRNMAGEDVGGTGRRLL